MELKVRAFGAHWLGTGLLRLEICAGMLLSNTQKFFVIICLLPYFYPTNPDIE